MEHSLVGEKHYGEWTLLCPTCGGDCTHTERVDVYEREEDAESGLHVAVSDLRVKVTTDLAGNPSPRRYGIRIQVSCEECGGTATLAVYQHKGTTYLYWEKEDI